MQVFALIYRRIKALYNEILVKGVKSYLVLYQKSRRLNPVWVLLKTARGPPTSSPRPGGAQPTLEFTAPRPAAHFKASGPAAYFTVHGPGIIFIIIIIIIFILRLLYQPQDGGYFTWQTGN